MFTTKNGKLLLPASQIQAIIFSIQKSLLTFQSAKFRKEHPSFYPPEILVLVSCRRDSDKDKNTLHIVRRLLSVFNLRIVKVDRISVDSIYTNESNDKNEISELHIFNQQSYNSIMFIKQECIVLENIVHMFELVQNGTVGITAASYCEQSGKFGSTFMTLRPSYSLFDRMIQSLASDYKYESSRSTNDICSEFLNFYYSENNFSLPKKVHLRSKLPNEEMNTDTAHILHFSSFPKPWENQDIECDTNNLHIWKSVYEESQLWIGSRKQRQKELFLKREKKKESMKTAKNLSSASTNANDDILAIHKSVAANYKVLRKKGYSAKEAMIQSRFESGDIDAESNPGASVAAMFGLTS